MKTAAKFRLEGVEVSAEPYHYKMCGLDDIYLMNGFYPHATKYGKGVSIENVECLHQVIGQYLIQNRKALGPKDIKFLRKNMNETQEEFAYRLGLTSQTLARYEKGQSEIPGPVDKLVRLEYAMSLLPMDQSQKAIDELRASTKTNEVLDEVEDHPAYFNNSNDGWTIGRRTSLHEMNHCVHA